MKHCEYLLGTESEDVVFEWCMILASSFGAAERVGLLREVVICRESLATDLKIAGRLTGTDVRPLVRMVEELVVRMGGMRQSNMNEIFDVEKFENRGQPRQQGQLGWDEDTHPEYMSMRSNSPQRRRVLMQQGPFWNAKNDENAPYGMQIAMRQRPVSHGNGGDRLRLQKLERRLHDAEEAITWIAAKRLNLEEGFEVSRREPWSEDEYAFI